MYLNWIPLIVIFLLFTFFFKFYVFNSEAFKIFYIFYLIIILKGSWYSNYLSINSLSIYLWKWETEVVNICQEKKIGLHKILYYKPLWFNFNNLYNPKRSDNILYVFLLINNLCDYNCKIKKFYFIQFYLQT